VKPDLKHLLGYLGSAIVFTGLFLPVFELPAVGRVNYFWNGLGDGMVLLLLVAGSVGALISGRLWVLWLTGASSLVLIGFTLLRVVLQASVAATQLSWGWPVLFIGGSLLVASAEVGRREGVTVPRGFRDVVLATSVLLAAVVVGPTVLSGTHQAVSRFEATKKLEERGRWVPHASARAEMAATRAQVRDEQGRRSERADEERREEERARRRRAEARRAAQVRLVADIRRWYPRFGETLRPVLDARQTFLEDYDAGGLAGAQSACAAVAQEVQSARERFPAGPDRGLDAMISDLLDLYLASAEACRGEVGTSTALTDLERTEERIGARLRGLADSLAAYCLQVPAVEGRSPQSPASVLACDPRDRAALAPAPAPAPVGQSTLPEVKAF
jgi:hypothetical protein